MSEPRGTPAADPTPALAEALARAESSQLAAEIRAAVKLLVGDPDPPAHLLLAGGLPGHRLEALRREMERAGEGLAPIIDGLRRTRLVAWDTTTTTWEAWDTHSGERCLTRLPRPRAQVTAVRTPSLDAILTDLLPLDADECAEPAWRVAVLAGVAERLARIHAEGHVHGAVHPDLVVQVEGVWTLAWLGPRARPARGGPTVEDDLRGLGRIGVALGDPLAADFAAHPPPSALDAQTLLLATLGHTLAGAHHALVRAARHHGTRRRASALRVLTHRLGRTLPPPTIRACVRAGHDAVLTLVESDGSVVRGGPSAGPHFHLLPVLLHDGLLDAAAARAVLRAWSMRAAGDEARRDRVQGELGATDDRTGQLMRWLSAHARLRVDTLLLERSA